MSFDYEKSRANLAELVQWYKQNMGSRNEATTRLQLIDDLFFNCLGWSKTDVNLEEPYEKKYADYVFFNPRRLLIIEAKKEGDYFEVPSGYNSIEYSLSTIIKDNQSIKKAVEQCAGYCQSRGVPLGAVSNGHQLIVFIATRNDGIAPLEGRALVFSSIETMLEKFLDLWQAVSKPGIAEKKLLKRLLGEVSETVPAKLSSTIPQYPGVRNRNIFQTDLKIVSELIIEDVIRSPELEETFLKECYCQSGALSQYALISKNILQSRYAALFDDNNPHPTIESVSTKKGISSEIAAQSLSRRPILLIGDVGVGKTIFIRNLIKIEAASLFKNAISLYIDFGSQATLISDIRLFLVDEIIRQLREIVGIDIMDNGFVRSVYHGELQRLKNSIYKDYLEKSPEKYKDKEIAFLEDKIKNKEEHLKKSIQHICKAQKKQIIIFLDNADQRDDATQQAVFLISQELAEHWFAMVFVSIRPETFHLSMRTGALSGYHPKAFSISPPRVDLVINRRLKFATKLTSGEIPIQSLSSGITIQLNTLGAIIAVLIRSFEKNAELIEFLDNFSNGNIRLALDLIKGFLGSGHVDTEKIYSKASEYVVPLHEFLRAVIYGDNEHYDPDRSPIANIFDISSPDPKEHFLLPVLILSLSLLGDASVEEGFVEIGRVYSSLQGWGFTPDQIDMAIIRSCSKKLIETSARKMPKRGEPMPQAIRATTVGIYHVSKLCRQFAYIDAIIVDTPILDNAIRDKIIDTHDIQLRLNRAEMFCQYLDNQSNFLQEGIDKVFKWEDIAAEIRAHVERITKKVHLQIQGQNRAFTIQDIHE
jgi:GTPase SAR1 family protein